MRRFCFQEFIYFLGGLLAAGHSTNYEAGAIQGVTTYEDVLGAMWFLSPAAPSPVVSVSGSIPGTKRGKRFRRGLHKNIRKKVGLFFEFFRECVYIRL